MLKTFSFNSENAIKVIMMYIANNRRKKAEKCPFIITPLSTKEFTIDTDISIIGGLSIDDIETIDIMSVYVVCMTEISSITISRALKAKEKVVECLPLAMEYLTKNYSYLPKQGFIDLVIAFISEIIDNASYGEEINEIWKE